MLVIDLRSDANIRPYNLRCNQSDVQLHMLTDVLGVGVQHGLDDVAQELGDLLGAAARKGFGGELGLDFFAGQAECRVSLDAGNHVVGLALLLDNGSSGHGVLTQTLVQLLTVAPFFTALIMMFSLAMNGSSAMTRARTTFG